MTGLVRKATLLAGVCGLIWASAASANVPDPAHCYVSTIDRVAPGAGTDSVITHIITGGMQTSSGASFGGGGNQILVNAPDPSIFFDVVVKDAGGAAIIGSTVVVDASLCTDTRFCTIAIAGQALTCVAGSAGKVTASTGAGGRVRLNLLGGGIVHGTYVAGPGLGCVKVYADGQLIGTKSLVDFDLDGAAPSGGSNGLTATDLTSEKADIGAIGLGSPYVARSDIDANGAVNSADLSAIKIQIGQSGLGVGSGGGCKTGGVGVPYCP